MLYVTWNGVWSEISFSTARRLKMWLRSSMTHITNLATTANIGLDQGVSGFEFASIEIESDILVGSILLCIWLIHVYLYARFYILITSTCREVRRNIRLQLINLNC